MGKYKYLGVRVKDIGKEGLTHAREFYAIARAIVADYRNRRISKKTAMGRLLLLYRLTYKKNNSKITFNEKTAKKIRVFIEQQMHKLKGRKGKK